MRTPRGALLAPIMALGLTWACKPQETRPAAAQSTDAEQGPQAPTASQASQGNQHESCSRGFERSTHNLVL